MNPRDQKLIYLFIALSAALVAVSCTGCASTSSGGVCDRIFSSQPDTLEFPGKEHFWSKSGLVISPARISAQVGTEVPMFAGVCDEQGSLMPYEKVEWTLDNSGVGSFIDVAEAHRPFLLNLVSDKPKKVDASYAIGETLPANVILTRGTKDINDDMVMPHGYTWVTVSSGKEGISYVTAFAPDVYSWNARQRSAQIHWIDAEWSFPEPTCGAVGRPVTICTCVVKHTTKTPVSDWIVKYSITGGAAAGLGKDNSTSTEVVTDGDGRACVDLIPAAETSSGTTCIRVELIRSECANGSTGERLPVASSSTQVTWGAGAVEAPSTPTTVSPAQPVTPSPVPGPAPRPIQPPIAPPQIQGPVAPAPQPVAVAKLELNVNGPASAQLGEDIAFDIQVTNRGDARAAGLVIVDQHDRNALRHYNSDGSADTGFIQKDLGQLAPGQSTQLRVQFRVMAPGNVCHVVEVRGPNGAYATKQACVNVAAAPPKPAQAAVSVQVSMPQTPNQSVFRVNDLINYRIDVLNTDPTLTAQNVKVTMAFDAGLTVVQLSQGANPIPGGMEMTIPNLPPTKPNEQPLAIGVQCRCVAPTQRACGTVTLSDATGQRSTQPLCVQILPALPAPATSQSGLTVSIHAVNNPIRQNGETDCRITITNGGLNPERQVQLQIHVPPTVQIVGTPSGPSAVQSSDNQTVTFQPVLEMRQTETLPQYTVRLRPMTPGPVEISAQLISQNTLQPIRATETITVNP